MALIEGSEPSANIKQTLGKHPKVNTVNTEHSVSLKSRMWLYVLRTISSRMSGIIPFRIKLNPEIPQSTELLVASDVTVQIPEFSRAYLFAFCNHAGSNKLYAVSNYIMNSKQ
jgi:hypothetical protein